MLGHARNQSWKLILLASLVSATGRTRRGELGLLALVITVWCLEFPQRACAQGPLAPPGAPTPSMKSLDQIEARTPISSLPFTISSSGSYYLTKDLSVSTGNGLTINADNVTVDLNGFTISSTAASATGTGILLNGTRTNITIQHGRITGSVTQSGGSYTGGGFANGIAFTTEPSDVRVSAVTVSGCLSGGIILHFNSTVVESCVVNTVGSYGIYAQTVSNSSAINCGFDGLQVQTTQNCFGSSVSGGTGLYANLAAVNSGGSSSTNDGLYALNATNCYGSSTSGSHGLHAFSANNCYGYHGGAGDGVNAYNVQNCYGQSSSGNGIQTTNANNSTGISDTGNGLIASGAASSCFGSTNGIANGGNKGAGISAQTAFNCFGVSTSTSGLGGIGVVVGNGFGCYGQTAENAGFFSSAAAAMCCGENTTSHTVNCVLGAGDGSVQLP